MTVAENVFLNAYPGERAGFVSWRAMQVEGRRLLQEWGIDVDANTLASKLPVGQRQLLEIVRALRLGSRFVILDEPTAQLEASEIVRLFDHMRRLHELGVAFLYISHHLDEIYEVCDTVTVLRDGQVVVAAPVGEMSKQQIVTAMVGGTEPITAVAASRTDGPSRVGAGGPVLTVRDLTIEGWCSGVNLEVRAGEFVGLAGLAASGKAQVADAIVGIVRPAGGEVILDGRPIPPGRVDLAIAHGLGYLPGDRQVRGLCPDLSVEENVTMSVLGRLGSAGFIDRRRRASRARELIDLAQILVSTPRQLPSELSGGNQQKTVFARAVASTPKALVLVTPTAGVDVASKRALLEKIQQSGVAVLLVSDELDELAICNRVLVMFAGRVTREFGSGWQDRELVAAMEGVGRGGG
jgi:simple sugar transport system ATP-binding protein